jgi:hypothetical protein
MPYEPGMHNIIKPCKGVIKWNKTDYAPLGPLGLHGERRISGTGRCRRCPVLFISLFQSFFRPGLTTSGDAGDALR